MTGTPFMLFRSGSALAPTMVEECSSSELIELIASGDQEAFDTFYRRFAPMVHGITLSRVPRNDVDDLVQEVFISAFRNIRTLRDGNAIGAWLATIARNRAAEYFRRFKPADQLPDDLSHCDPAHAEAGEIMSAIRNLPDSYRETLVLRLVEGMTGREIADQTGMTPDSVRVNLHRGMKLLRQKLGLEVVK